MYFYCSQLIKFTAQCTSMSIIYWIGFYHICDSVMPQRKPLVKKRNVSSILKTRGQIKIIVRDVLWYRNKRVGQFVWRKMLQLKSASASCVISHSSLSKRFFCRTLCYLSCMFFWNCHDIVTDWLDSFVCVYVCVCVCLCVWFCFTPTLSTSLWWLIEIV